MTTLDTPPIPGVEPEPASTTKRGPGRPRGSKSRAPAGPTGKVASDRAPRPPGRPSTDDKLTEQLADAYALAGGLVAVIAPQLGDAVADSADRCAAAWVNLAKRNARVRKLLEAGVEGGGWLGLALAHGPIFAAVYGTVRGGELAADAGSPPLDFANVPPDAMAAAMAQAAEMLGGHGPVDLSRLVGNGNPAGG